MANYNTMRLYEEIKNEMRNVIEAEENSKAWKIESRIRMKDVDALITAARKVNKGVEIDKAVLVAEIRAELAAEAEEESAYEEPEEAEYPEEAEDDAE